MIGSQGEVWYHRNRGNSLERSAKMPDYNPEDYQLSQRDKRIKELMDGGMGREEAIVTVDAELVDAGVENEDEAHRADDRGTPDPSDDVPAMHVTRVQAPHKDASDDPSPDPEEFRRTGPG